jgi:hypothetical protein
MELVEYFIAAGCPNDIDVPNVFVPREGRDGGDLRVLLEKLVVKANRFPALFVPSRQVAKFGQQNGGLHRIEARVEAHEGVNVLGISTVISQCPNLVSELVGLG